MWRAISYQASDLATEGLVYYIRPQYDLGMTLIASYVVDDGIVIAADRRGKGVYKDTGETIMSDAIKKIYHRNSFVWAISGKGITDPQEINNYLDEHLVIESGDSLKQITAKIVEATHTFHEIINYRQPKLVIMVAGFEGDEPLLYGAMKLNGKVEFEESQHYLAYGRPDYVHSKFRYILSATAEQIREDFDDAFLETSKQFDTVSPLFDSYLIRKDAISVIS